jgi:class 3 adenylate cyclase
VLPAWDGVGPVQAQQFEAATRRGLATDPSRRPATPGELVERLRAGWAQALPTGVVTFCVSDIPGSAAHWEGSPIAMATALVRHDEVIAESIARHGGRLITSIGQGDSTVSVFESAPAAVAAALSAGRALDEEHWPSGLPIRARFALRTGAADGRGTDYYGPSMNLTVWLRGQADSGEIVVSTATAELAAGRLPDGYTLVDLGPHAPEGGGSAESVYALRGPGVQAPLAVSECPYRGLLAFEPEDRNYFFGHEPVVSGSSLGSRPGAFCRSSAPRAAASRRSCAPV